MSDTQETTNAGGAADAETPRLLGELRRALLRLHKTLLDAERETYEQRHGRVSSGELLQLVIADEHFAWLHAVSELIVRVDELLDAEEPPTERDAQTLLAETRALLKPSETGGGFGRKYFAALQRAPDAVLAHREVTRLLSASGGA